MSKSENIEFDSISFECKWDNFNVYVPLFDTNGDCFVGLPKYILIDKQKNIRLAKNNEIYEILENLSDDE